MKCGTCERRIYPSEIYSTFYYCHHCDWTYEYEEKEEKLMDKKIKKLQKDTKKLAKEESQLLKMDKKNDKIVDKAKKKMKEKC